MGDHLGNGGVDLVETVPFAASTVLGPLHNVEVRGVIEGHGVAVEEVCVRSSELVHIEVLLRKTFPKCAVRPECASPGHPVSCWMVSNCDWLALLAIELVRPRCLRERVER